MNTPDRSRDTAVGVAASLFAVVGWSIGPIFIKYLTGSLDAWTQNFYRYLAASLACVPILLIAARRGRLAPGVWKLALLPAIPNTIMQCFWAAGFYYVNPGFVTLLAQSGVVWTTLFAVAAFPEERPLLRVPALWAGIALSGAGVVGVVLARPDFEAKGTLSGIVLILCSTLFCSTYTVTARGVFRRIPARQAFAVTCLYTTVGLGIVGLIMSRQILSPPSDARVWASIAFSGVLSITITHIIYYVAQKRIGAMMPSLILLLIPFTTLAISAVVYHERLLPAQWIWGVVLIAGSGLFVIAHRALERR